MGRNVLGQVQSQGKRASTTQRSLPSNEQEIAQVAYQLFERRGRVHGHHFQDWLEAERIVRQRRGNGANR